MIRRVEQHRLRNGFVGDQNAVGRRNAAGVEENDHECTGSFERRERALRLFLVAGFFEPATGRIEGFFALGLVEARRVFRGGVDQSGEGVFCDGRVLGEAGQDLEGLEVEMPWMAAMAWRFSSGRVRSGSDSLSLAVFSSWLSFLSPWRNCR